MAPDALAAVEPGPAYREVLVQLMRAHDSFGVWAGRPDDAILAGYVMTKEKRRAIPLIGDPDSKAVWRLEVFYTAVATAVSRVAGLDATALVKLSSEGFGRAIVMVGRLVALDRSVRDVHRFGFESVDALSMAGDALLADCLRQIDRFPDAARADD